jgi:predicted SnoaL-like aldol condensation-catalyzing enzyme
MLVVLNTMPMKILTFILASWCLLFFLSCKPKQNEKTYKVPLAVKDCSEIEKKADSLKKLNDSIILVNQETGLEIKREKSAMQLIADMYNELFIKKDLSAIDKYFADKYIQHNPNLGDGKEALMAALKYKFDISPNEKPEIMRMAVNDDIVFVHIRLTSGNKTASVTDIYRVKDNKITEHWDVIQEVPRRAVSRHPMF